MTTLPDVNVLVALMHKQHEHNSAAWQWANSLQDANSIRICRISQMGGLRLLSQARIMREFAVSAEQFWTAWDQMMQDTRFASVAEPTALEATWRNLTKGLPVGTKLETDTYLAAFAIAGDFKLVTFDRGFLRYPGLNTEILA